MISNHGWTLNPPAIQQAVQSRFRELKPGQWDWKNPVTGQYPPKVPGENADYCEQNRDSIPDPSNLTHIFTVSEERKVSPVERNG